MSVTLKYSCLVFAAFLLLSVIPLSANAILEPPVAFNGENRDYGVDFDKDGLYDVLTINVGVNVAVEGSYGLLADAFDLHGNLLTQIFNVTDLPVNSEEIILLVRGPLFFSIHEDGPLYLRNLRVFEFPVDVNSPPLAQLDEVQTSSYNYLDFKRPGAFFISQPNFQISQGVLRIERQVQVSEPGAYDFVTELRDGTGSLASQASERLDLPQGESFVTLMIDISRVEPSSAYFIQLTQIFDSDALLISFDHSQYDVSTLLLSGDQIPTGFLVSDFKEFLGDLDENGKASSLRVEAPFYLQEEITEITAYADLTDQAGMLITTARLVIAPEKSIVLAFAFDGQQIANSGMDGPYQIRISVRDERGSVIVESPRFETRPYKSSDFRILELIEIANVRDFVEGEILNFELTLASPSQSEYVLVGVLLADSTFLETSAATLTSGMQVVLLSFNGTRLGEARGPSSYILDKVEIYDSDELSGEHLVVSQQLGYRTGVYDFQQQIPSEQPTTATPIVRPPITPEVPPGIDTGLIAIVIVGVVVVVLGILVVTRKLPFRIVRSRESEKGSK